jgi:hypothetical protein
MARPKSGPCWKCEKQTKSHVDLLMVYFPGGHVRHYIHTCHPCWNELKEGELTEYKIQLRDEIKAKAVAALQNQKVEAVRNEQDVLGSDFFPGIWKKRS